MTRRNNRHQARRAGDERRVKDMHNSVENRVYNRRHPPGRRLDDWFSWASDLPVLHP